MKLHSSRVLGALLWLSAVWCAGCDDGPAADADADLDADADTDLDGDVETDAEADGDVDGDVEADGDVETPACEDDCEEGSQSCDGESGYRLCGQYDLDDCFELSPSISCAAGYLCEGGRCVSSCRDLCPVGSSICADESTRQFCGNFDTDACLEPGGGTACEASERCEAGACVDLDTPCDDECSAGEVVCFGDALRTCGDFDTDLCLDLGPPEGCGLGDVCRGGACVDACWDECPGAGATGCLGNDVRLCGDLDDDGCLEWSASTPCDAGETCSGGICSAECADDCTEVGGMLCTSDGTGVNLCGDYDDDECLDVNSPIPCPLGFACEGGLCVASCANDCALGTPSRCGADHASIETCGGFDEDPCTEWGGQVLCPGGASCVDGACDVPCDDTCDTAGATECTSNATHTCGQWDLDPCLEWSTPVDCEGFETCVAGRCELGDPPAEILINEALYDSDGTDTAAGNLLFVELWGPAGQALDNYELVGVNGADGVEYNAIDLGGEVIAADGYFVIAHPAASDELLDVSDITSGSVDYQNGPDSIVLRWRTRVVDALGYGDFAAARFAGEGTPAAACGAGESLSRDASHADTDDNAADFTALSAPSPREGSVVCVEECTAGESRCVGDQVETCGNFDADDCLEWSGAADCPVVGELCRGATCQVPCTHECATSGAAQCVGDQISTCGDHDLDGCFEWGVAADCPAGERCVVDWCQAETAPEVVMITPHGTIQTTQGATHRILVDVIPAPGRRVTEVRFYAGGALVGTTVAAPHQVDYTVPALAPTGTMIALQARAVDDAGDTGVSAYSYLDVRNDPPVAGFTATITDESTVTVDASACTDTETDGEDLEVCWDWNDDGTCDTGWSTDKVTTHDFGASGEYTIRLVVRDAIGQTDETTRDVSFADIQYIGGTTVSTTTWYGTIIITGDVTVPAGETLTISSGTQVLFIFADVAAPAGVGDYTLIVDGALVVEGTEEEPVIFSGYDLTGKVPGGWDAIVINGAGSTIDHALIEYADVGLNASADVVITDTTVQRTLGDCLQLDNADGAELTDVTVTECGNNGVSAYNGSTGVVIDRLTATSNTFQGVSIWGSAAVSIIDSTMASNDGDGARAGTGSTLSIASSTLEDNDGAGVSFRSTSNGLVQHNQIRENGAEGVLLLDELAGSPSPTINTNNIYSNAMVGSSTAASVSTAATLTASYTCCYSSSTSAAYTAPAGATVRRVYVSYDESDNASNYVQGSILNASTGATVQTFNSDFTGWVYLPDGISAIQVRVADSGYSYTADTITASTTDIWRHDGAADVSAITSSGTVDLQYNYLGTFPAVLSRVSMSRNTALNLQGFVGDLFDDTWDRGPYKAGTLSTETWNDTIYVTGNLTIPAGQTLTVAAGTQVLFVNHDQNGDGDGDFSITAPGALDVSGAAGAEVVFTGQGTPSGDVFQAINLQGSGADASTWDHAIVRHGLTPIVITGASDLSDVHVYGQSGRGVSVTGGSGAALTRVTVEESALDGFFLRAATGTTLSRVSATDNLGVGVRIEGGATPVIEDSTIRDNAGHGVSILDANPQLNYNLIVYNGGAGVRVGGNSDPTASYNIIRYNDDVGVSIWTETSGSPDPTFQYSNIYGNSVVGSASATSVSTAATLAASYTCCYSSSTSAAYTAPAGATIRRVYVSYDESDNASNYVQGTIVNATSGAAVQTFNSDFTGWVYLPDGISAIQVRVADSGYSYTADTITASTTEYVTLSAVDLYELVSVTDAGTTNAQFNFWTSSIGDVPGLIYQSRAGSVNYTGFTGAEYPSGAVTAVGPRP